LHYNTLCRNFAAAMDNMISVIVQDNAGNFQTIEAPTDMGLNLMEVLKGSDYAIEATCGGMALCATCHIRVMNGLDKLKPQGNDELDMLDTLPVIYPESRLSCQIHISEEIDGIEIKLFQ
jgi:ferredoxin